MKKLVIWAVLAMLMIPAGASALELNPFNDLSAQFDFLIRTSSTDRHEGLDSLVIRIRAAYLGAFNRLNQTAADPNESRTIGTDFRSARECAGSAVGLGEFPDRFEEIKPDAGFAGAHGRTAVH